MHKREIRRQTSESRKEERKTRKRKVDGHGGKEEHGHRRKREKGSDIQEKGGHFLICFVHLSVCCPGSIVTPKLKREGKLMQVK